MKRSTLFLQTIVVLFGLAVLAALLIEPWFEGHNANAGFFQIYFQDAFLAYTYAASIAFFVILYQVFSLLGLVRRGEASSPVSAKALSTIKRCGLLLIAFAISSTVWLLFTESDDRPPIPMLALLFTLACLTLIALADVFEKLLQESAG